MNRLTRIALSVLILAGITVWKLSRGADVERPDIPIPSYVTQIDGYSIDPKLFDDLYLGAYIRVLRLNGFGFEAEDVNSLPVDPIEKRDEILQEMMVVAGVLSNSEAIVGAIERARAGSK